MKLEDPPRERRRFELIAAVMGVVMGATAIGFFAIVILAADEPPPAPSPTATPSAPSTTPVTEGVALTEPVDLRSGPASDVAIVTRLAMTEPIRVVGRSADGAFVLKSMRTCGSVDDEADGVVLDQVRHVRPALVHLEDNLAVDSGHPQRLGRAARGVDGEAEVGELLRHRDGIVLLA